MYMHRPFRLLSDGTKHALTSTCTDEEAPPARSINACLHVWCVECDVHGDRNWVS